MQPALLELVVSPADLQWQQQSVAHGSNDGSKHHTITCLCSQSGCRMRGTGLLMCCIAAGMVMIFWMVPPRRSR